MSFEALEGLASEWADVLPPEVAQTDPAAVLRTARSLFSHAWYDYEFMAVACLVAFQAMEAAFRELYPDAPKKPLAALVRRARTEGVLPPAIADLGETGVELRNLLSHPATAAAFTVGMAAGVLEQTHRMVALVGMAAIAQARTELVGAEGRRPAGAARQSGSDGPAGSSGSSSSSGGSSSSSTKDPRRFGGSQGSMCS